MEKVWLRGLLAALVLPVGIAGLMRLYDGAAPASEFVQKLYLASMVGWLMFGALSHLFVAMGAPRRYVPGIWITFTLPWALLLIGIGVLLSGLDDGAGGASEDSGAGALFGIGLLFICGYAAIWAFSYAIYDHWRHPGKVGANAQPGATTTLADEGRDS